jgi:phosphatidate cytidylyltransferase
MNAWSNVECEVNPVFLWRAVPLPAAISSLLTQVVSPISELISGHGMVIRNFQYAPFQMHTLFMAAFASLVAPFGGFFASGFKRGECLCRGESACIPLLILSLPCSI